MLFRIIRKFFNLALALIIFIVSTGMFAFWWYTRRPEGGAPITTNYQPAKAEERQKIIEAKVAALPAKMGWLALVGNDLYDISTDELLLPRWLGGMPLRMFYQKDVNKLMVLTERGVIRFGLDGKKDAAMGEQYPPAFTWDGKLAAYIKDGDIWLGETDWKSFTLKNERQVTKFGKFIPQFFAANIKLFSENALSVRLNNGILRVDLKTGEIKPVNVPQNGLETRRSPDGHVMFGDVKSESGLFDIDKDGDGRVQLSGLRDRPEHYQWLDNDRCALLNDNGKTVSVYDRRTGKIADIVQLPFACDRIFLPSLKGSFVFCAARQGAFVVDVLGKKIIPIEWHGQGLNWTSDSSLIYEQDVPDTSLRGTWFLEIGQKPRLVIQEPFIANRDGSAAVALLKEVDLVAFATKDALYRMKQDGTELQEIAKLAKPAVRILVVEIWGE